MPNSKVRPKEQFKTFWLGSILKINIIKFEMIKMLLETVLTEQDIVDEKLGMKSSANTSIPFRIAFNSLLNKKLINHY